MILEYHNTNNIKDSKNNNEYEGIRLLNNSANRMNGMIMEWMAELIYQLNH